MVVAAGDQSCTGRRTERRRVKLRIAQSRLGDAIHVRGRDDATKSASHSIALVVGHDQQHVRRTFGGHYGRWPVRLGIFGILLDLTTELRRLRRKLLAVEGDCRARRTWRPRDWLGRRVRRKRHAEENT